MTSRKALSGYQARTSCGRVGTLQPGMYNARPQQVSFLSGVGISRMVLISLEPKS